VSEDGSPKTDLQLSVSALGEVSESIVRRAGNVQLQDTRYKRTGPTPLPDIKQLASATLAEPVYFADAIQFS